MSSDALHHNNQQQLFHNRYEYDYHIHNGYMDGRAEAAHSAVECHHDHHDEEIDRQQSDSIIRGNMQYVNGELRKIPRPLNAFMIFSNEKRKELKKAFPGEPNNMISSRLGAAWKGLSDEARKKYHDMAHREDLEHRRKYPNYQYCPGHARKLKKARREQRLRQQGMYRGSRHSRGGPALAKSASNARRRVEVAKQVTSSGGTTTSDTCCAPAIKQEDEAMQGYATSASASSASQHTSTAQIIDRSTRGAVSAATIQQPGPFGEGCYSNSSTAFLAPPDVPAECILSCCSGCKPTDIYCCPESHWNGEAFSAGSYPPPMFYFTPGYETQFPSDPLATQPCLMSGDCNACYPAANYMDACYGTLYPAAGDASMCFMPELPMSTSPPLLVTQAGCVTVSGVSDGDTELTDISNSMVPSACSQDGRPSLHDSCASKGSPSLSPDTLQDISPPPSLSATDM